MAVVERAWRDEPSRIDLACQLYDVLVSEQRLHEAAEVMRTMLEQRPDDASASYRIGECLLALQEPEKAAEYYRRAGKAEPGPAHEWLDKALALKRLERWGEAEDALRHFLTLESSPPQPLHGTYHLIGTLIETDRLSEAARLLEESIDRYPDAGDLLAPVAMHIAARGFAAGEVLARRILERGAMSSATAVQLVRDALSMEMPDLAVACVQRAREQEDSPELRFLDATALPVVPMSVEDIRHWTSRYTSNIESLIGSGLRLEDPVMLFRTAPERYLPQIGLFCYGLPTRDLYAATARMWEEVAPQLRWSAPHCRSRRWRPRRGRRIRVGFCVAPDFPLLWGLARELDRDRFEAVEIFERYGDWDQPSPWSTAVDRQITYAESDLGAAQQAIASERLDVVVHTPSTPMTYFLSGARLAPVQCVLAEPAWTDGLSAVDYYVSWGRAEPLDATRWYSASVALMERPPYWVEHDYCTPADRGREDFDLPQDVRWYLCPISPIKLHPSFDKLLGGLLRADPDGMVILLRGGWHHMNKVRRRLRETIGANADRVHVLPTLPADHCHRLLKVADAVLDAWPIGGMSSSYAAIHVGAPTVTLPVQQPFGRWLAALYEWIGVTDLIARDKGHYVELALRLARDPNWRQELGDRIRARNHLVIEDRLAVRELEAFFIAAVDAARRGRLTRPWRSGRFVST